MARTIDVDLECWFCERPLERERVLAEGLLVPRRAVEGGPWLRYDCPTCGIEVHVERNRAGALPCGGRSAVTAQNCSAAERARARVEKAGRKLGLDPSKI